MLRVNCGKIVNKYTKQMDIPVKVDGLADSSDLLIQSPPTSIRMLSDILPEEPLLMMGAGPVPIPAPVAHANSIVINPGSAAMEMAVANLLEPDDKCLCICNGYFSGRLAEMASRLGADVICHTVAERESVAADVVASLLAKHNPKVLTIVQGETSSTVCNRELPLICEAAHKHGCLIIVDAVCTLSTMPLQMEACVFRARLGDALSTQSHNESLVSGCTTGRQILVRQLVPLHRTRVGCIGIA